MPLCLYVRSLTGKHVGRLVRRYPVCRLHQESQPSLVVSARMKQVGYILDKSKTFFFPFLHFFFFTKMCRRVFAFSSGLCVRCVPGRLGWTGAVYREGIEFSVRDNVKAFQRLDTGGRHAGLWSGCDYKKAIIFAKKDSH